MFESYKLINGTTKQLQSVYENVAMPGVKNKPTTGRDGREIR